MAPRLPHPLLERLIARWLGDAQATRFVIGDLREDYAALATRHSVIACSLWYLTQGLRLGARLRWSRRHLQKSVPAPNRHPPALRGDLMSTDLKQSARSLLRRPVFSGAVVLTVALAISTTTLAFAVLDGVLLEPLPYSDPSRLVAIWEVNSRNEDRNVVSPINFHTWREQVKAFDGVASLVEGSTTFTQGEPERVGVVRASATYFDLVGAEALVGRLYTEAEDATEAENVTVISERYWRTRFAADPSVVGRQYQLGGFPYTIVGVLPERFDFALEWSFGGVGSHDFWLPPRLPPEERQAGGRYLTVIGRLAPGASISSARQETDALAARLAEQFPDRQRGWGISVQPLRDDMIGEARETILTVFGAVCLVLLIACANVANLLLTRATERQQEMAVRSAMGAGTGRIVQQLLIESTLLSAVGGALGLLLAWRGVSALVSLAPDLPRIEDVSLDGTVLAFALLTTVGTAALFGLAPALPASRGTVAGWLRDKGTRTRRETQRTRATLAVAQTALSLVLLVGAGLLGRSLINRLDVGVGFDVEGLLTAEVRAPSTGPLTRTQLFEQLVERVRALPGVQGASAITWLPLAGGGTRTDFWRTDRPLPGPNEELSADVRWVHRDYPRTMGIPLLAGRGFGPGDDQSAPVVVLASQTAAEQIWPGEDPIGKRIAMPWGDTILAEVVGVVGDVRHAGPDTEPFPMFYWEHRQFSAFPQMSLVVRTEDDASVAAGIRAALKALDPGVPLYNVKPMESLFADAIKRARFATLAMGAFAALALLLAAIGIYGVMAHVTEQRIREIGIRMALGAGRGTILGMVVRQGMTQVGVAIVLGTLGALALSRLLGGLVFDVSTTDPATFGAMALLLAATGFLAVWLPARRASAIDPAETIRSE
jgi:putative ABC transport system permease protein